MLLLFTPSIRTAAFCSEENRRVETYPVLLPPDPDSFDCLKGEPGEPGWLSPPPGPPPGTTPMPPPLPTIAVPLLLTRSPATPATAAAATEGNLTVGCCLPVPVTACTGGRGSAWNEARFEGVTGERDGTGEHTGELATPLAAGVTAATAVATATTGTDVAVAVDW